MIGRDKAKHFSSSGFGTETAYILIITHKITCKYRRGVGLINIYIYFAVQGLPETKYANMFGNVSLRILIG